MATRRAWRGIVCSEASRRCCSFHKKLVLKQSESHSNFNDNGSTRGGVNLLGKIFATHRLSSALKKWRFKISVPMEK